MVKIKRYLKSESSLDLFRWIYGLTNIKNMVQYVKGDLNA